MKLPKSIKLPDIPIWKPDKNSIWTFWAIAVCILGNAMLAYVAHLFKLPLYMDMVFTIAIATLAGQLPGFIVAVCTTLACTPFNTDALYFMFIGIVVADCTAYFMRRDKNPGPLWMMLYIMTMAILSGSFGTVVQWILYGDLQFRDVAELARFLSGGGGKFYFFCALIVMIILNIVDKGIAVLLARLVLRLIPERRKRWIANSKWKQRPLSEEEIRTLSHSRNSRKKSLRRRMSQLIIVATLSVAGVMAFTGYRLYLNTMDLEYRENANRAAEFAAEAVQPELIDLYLDGGQFAADYDGTGYRETNKILLSISKSISGISDLYIFRPAEEGILIAFDTNPEYQERGVLGEQREYDGILLNFRSTLNRGEAIEPQTLVTPYGRFFVTYRPVYDASGNCVAYVGAETSTNDVRRYMGVFALRVLLVFAGFFMLILSFGLWIAKYYLVFPLNSMAGVTRELVENTDTQMELDEKVRNLKDLEIHTGDEVEQLYKVLCKMSSDTAEQIRDIRHYADSTARMQNGLIITMADMVENRDADTGAHIQKTVAYVRIILEGLKKKGYYAEKITPKYMSDVEMSAPLHDVGKINIPDNILNKPGKLTPDEFEIMKTHTTAGKEIMEKAISTVSGENYLKEARNMAGYHHERWDGKGYPEGLHGEVIPLSARVMAVADVFDALTSARVYKPPFSMEEALKIISDGAGTQFDPKCVEVFLDSLEDVEKVLRKYSAEGLIS